MDNSADTDVAVVGFDFSGDDMLRGELLSFEQGLTVLYGLNGTGKSRLLRGIRGALLGIQTDVNISLVARAAVTAGVEELIERGTLSQASVARPFALALAQELAHPSDYLASPGQRSSERRLLAETVEAVILNHIEDMVGVAYPELRGEVLEDRLFLLAPTGTEGAPSWSAYAVADATRRGARNVIARVAEVDETFPDDDDDVEAFDSWVDRMRAVPILEATAQIFTARGPRAAAIRPFSVALYNAQVSELSYWAPISIGGAVDYGLDVLDLERDAADSTEDYLARLVAGALDRDWRRETSGEFDDAFPVGNPEDLQGRWRRLDESSRDNAARVVERTVAEAAAELGDRVTATLSDVLLDPLVARLEVAPSALRTAVPTLEWRFYRAAKDWVIVGMQSLSRAERQWAERSINEAIYWHKRDHDEQSDKSLRQVVYLLDEPESALHRAAEAFMARSLRARACDPRKALIVATHSPELLDTTEARLIGLQHAQTPHGPTVRQLDLSDRNLLGELGLTPSDLLRWPRVLLLVEGLHDEILLDHYLGDRLRAARVDILVLRGGTRLPLTVDSRVLFEHTEAHVVGLVDNENAKNLQATWERAQEAAVQGDTSAAIDIVLAGIPRERPEADFIRDWLTGALAHGLDGRITPYALERADVIEYLPVQAFIPLAASWEALKHEHRVARETVKGTAKEFKPWLQITYGVEFTEDALRAAAEGTPVPAELELFMKTLEAISARQG